jgi:hypothetical protein
MGSCRRLSEGVVQLWRGMHIEFMTHFAEGNLTRVVIKSALGKRETKWVKLVREMRGSELSVQPVTRHATLLHDLTTDANRAELEANRFTLEMNESLAEEAAEAPPETAEPALACFEMELSHPLRLGALFKGLVPRGAYEAMRHLRRYDLLETHRRVLVLEARVGAPAGQRPRAGYPIIDPVTLYVPALLNQRLGDDHAEVCGYREQALAAALRGLLAYGHRLWGQAGRPAEAAMEPPFEFLTTPTRAHLAAYDHHQQDGGLVARRLRKERADAGGVGGPLLGLHARVLAAAEGLLASDTLERGLTRHLPPTPSLPAAAYDVERFLAQF